MLMRWEDLLPRDVIELNPEFYKYGKDFYYWMDELKKINNK